MPHALQERRCVERIAMRLPLLVRLLDGNVHEEHTFTQDVSVTGVFSYMDAATGGQREVELTLTLPPDGKTPTGMQVRYTGRVARLEHSPDGRVGVAATFENCEYLARA